MEKKRKQEGEVGSNALLSSSPPHFLFLSILPFPFLVTEWEKQKLAYRQVRRGTAFGIPPQMPGGLGWPWQLTAPMWDAHPHLHRRSSIIILNNTEHSEGAKKDGCMTTQSYPRFILTGLTIHQPKSQNHTAKVTLLFCGLGPTGQTARGYE